MGKVIAIADNNWWFRLNAGGRDWGATDADWALIS